MVKKLGKVEIYNNIIGIISSENLKYRFHKEDIAKGVVNEGDEVEFVPEKYPYDQIDSQLVARFVKKKELSKR